MQQVTQGLIRKLTTLSQYEEALAKISATATDRLAVLKAKPQSVQRDILSICSDPFTVAQQLTHIELVSAFVCAFVCSCVCVCESARGARRGVSCLYWLRSHSSTG